MDPTIAAQRAAIREVRDRYERGELPYDAFRRALDALVLTESPEECQAVLSEVGRAASGSPHSAALAALDTGAHPARSPDSAPVSDPAPTQTAVISAMLGSVHKMRQSWRLAGYTLARSILGDLKLDLSRAEVPAHATIEVTCVLGSVIVYVPRAMRVRVASQVIIGDVKALGETVGGIVGSHHAEHAPATPANAEPAAELDIIVRNFGGSVKILLVDRPVVSVGDLVRQSIRFIAERMSRGLQEPYGGSPSRSLDRPPQPGLPGEPLR
jgi:hypothetical protein